MKARKVVLIAQAEVGQGKTTLLNTIRSYLPERFKCSIRRDSDLINIECMSVSWEDEAKLKEE